LSSLRDAGFDARVLSGDFDSVGVIGASRQPDIHSDRCS